MTTNMQENNQALAAIYLFNGDDELKRDTTLRRLSERIAASGDLLMNEETFNPESIKAPDQLLDILHTPPFGGQYRLVVINNAEKLDKNLAEALIHYLEKPLSSTVLVLLANKLAANTRLYKAIHTYNPKSIIDVSSIKRSELPHRLRQLAADYRVALDYQAAQSLIERVGTSMATVNNELKRLAAW
ncbi:MAG: hypothetical protein LBU61_06630, partial [Coriobacteriales bacterium]|nr:hypothetical protein [Coriobacteriales bacterium]